MPSPLTVADEMTFGLILPTFNGTGSGRLAPWQRLFAHCYKQKGEQTKTQMKKGSRCFCFHKEEEEGANLEK